LLTPAVLFCPGDRQPVVASSPRTPPLEIYGGGAHHLVEVVVEINSPLFVFWSRFYCLLGVVFLGGPRHPFSWPESGRTFRDHGGSPRVSAPQGDRFLGAKSVTIFWARNRALVVPVFFIFGGPKKVPEKYLARGPVHPKICPQYPYQGDRRTSLSASIRCGQTTSMRTPFLTTCRCEP